MCAMEVRKHFNVSGGYFERVTSLINEKWKLLHWSRKILEPYVTVQTIEHSMSSAVNYSMNATVLKATHGNDTMESSDTESLSVESSFILILLYTAITLMAIVGNSLAIIIFAKGKRSRTDLRPFLINLAVADLIMGMFCIPFTFTFQILDRWVFTEPMCPIVLFLQVVSVTASVSTNMTIGLDRFYAVKYPLKSRITSSKVRYIIVCIWIFAVGLSSVQLLVGRTTTTGDHVTCAEKWPEPRILLRRIYTLVVLVLTYIMPLLILTVTYTMIGRTLSQHKTPGNADESRDHQQLKSKRKIIKMLVTVVLLFGICWLPIHAFTLLLDFNQDIEKSSRKILTALYYSVFWLSMANCFVNPIIYGFMNDSFRADFRYLLFRWCACCSKHLKSRQPVRRWKPNQDALDSSSSSHEQPLQTKGLLTAPYKNEANHNNGRKHDNNCTTVSRLSGDNQ